MRYLYFAWCFVAHLAAIVFLHFYIYVTNNTKIQTCRIDFASTDLIGLKPTLLQLNCLASHSFFTFLLRVYWLSPIPNSLLLLNAFTPREYFLIWLTSHVSYSIITFNRSVNLLGFRLDYLHTWFQSQDIYQPYFLYIE